MTTAAESFRTSPSRRAVLVGAIGGLGAWAMSAIGRASPVRAESEPIVVGGDYTTATSLTLIKNQTNNAHVLRAESTADGDGLQGLSVSAFGVYGISTTSTGVYGTSTSSRGVYGSSGSFKGVHGFSNSGIGVHGESASAQGVRGTGVIGVEGVSESQFAWGVGGSNTAPGGFGVWGSAQGAGSRGVSGSTDVGRGVYGEATNSSGWAGYFKGRTFTRRYQEMQEISTPNAPGTNRARVFLRDNGSGKTQLCVRFSSGAVQVLATQP